MGKVANARQKNNYNALDGVRKKQCPRNCYRICESEANVLPELSFCFTHSFCLQLEITRNLYANQKFAQVMQFLVHQMNSKLLLFVRFQCVAD